VLKTPVAIQKQITCNGREHPENTKHLKIIRNTDISLHFPPSPPENPMLIRGRWTEIFCVTFKRKHAVYI